MCMDRFEIILWFSSLAQMLVSSSPLELPAEKGSIACLLEAQNYPYGIDNVAFVMEMLSCLTGVPSYPRLTRATGRQQ